MILLNKMIGLPFFRQIISPSLITSNYPIAPPYLPLLLPLPAQMKLKHTSELAEALSSDELTLAGFWLSLFTSIPSRWRSCLF